jgi:tetratricopeptide (TPR) repeat protein
MSGFKIIKTDTKMYGYTVLCKKSEKKLAWFDNDNYNDICAILENQQKALSFIQAKQFDQAIETFPKYPDAYIYKSLSREYVKDFKKQIDILKQGLKANPDNTRLKNQLAKSYFQWDQNKPTKDRYVTKNIEKAEKLFTELIEEKPGSEESYYFLAIIEGEYKKNYVEAVELLKKQIKMNPTSFVENYNLISYFWREKEKTIDN